MNTNPNDREFSLILADDETFAREGLAELDWHLWGFRLDGVFADGDGAYAWCDQYPVDVALLDIRMPGMTGLEMAERLSYEHPETLVVLLSAHSEFELAQRALRHGVFRYLTKPVEPVDVESTFREVYVELLQRRSANALVEQARRARRYRTILFGFRRHEDERDFDVGIVPANLTDHAGDLTVIAVPPWRVVPASLFRRELSPEADYRTDRGELIVCNPASTDPSVLRKLAAAAKAPLVVMHLGVHDNDVIPLLRSTIRELFWSGESVAWIESTSEPVINAPGTSSVLEAAFERVPTMMRCHPDQITREVRTFLNTLKEHGADRDDAVYAASAMLVALGERAEQDGYHDIGNEGTEFGRDAIERSSNAEELEAFMIAWITAFRERLTAFHTRITENDRMQRVVSYLREHISDPIGLNDVAEHVEMNPSAFSRWFRETHGSTFVDVCTHLRIDHAARMLLTTSSRIVDIAAMSGYPNARYFAAVFRRVVGVSPSEYRRNALESTNPNNSQEL